MANEAESALLREARTGDNLAFDELQQRLEPPIRRFVRRLIGVSHAEDDIVQDTFIALYKNMARIEPVENLRPYLFRIARNRCYDELRGLGRYDEVSLDDEPMTNWVSYNLEDDSPEPDDLVHWLFIYMEVQEAMERLPELQRQALILYMEQNLSYAEIAEAMDTTIGTIKSRLHHAKKTLRALLRPEIRELLEESFG